MDSVGTGFFRWSRVALVALILCGLLAQPALAGDLVVKQEVSSGISTFVGFGPPSSTCNGTTEFSTCTFFTTTNTSSGMDIPGGPFTASSTSTLYFGAGDFAVTVNGAANPDGTPAGYCLPLFSTTHLVYANGTIDMNGTGSVCCAGTSCGDIGIGPPTVSHLASACISGTGKYQGIQCSAETTSTSNNSTNFIVRSEIVSTK